MKQYKLRKQISSLISNLLTLRLERARAASCTVDCLNVHTGGNRKFSVKVYISICSFIPSSMHTIIHSLQFLPFLSFPLSFSIMPCICTTFLQLNYPYGCRHAARTFSRVLSRTFSRYQSSSLTFLKTM